MSARRREVAERVPEAVPGEDPVRRAVRALVVAILVLRWTVPTEGTSLGNTLWIAQFSLLVGALWGWSLVRTESPRVRFGWFDIALAALVGVHVLSAIAVVVRGDGDGRAAVNVAWEWVAVFVTFAVARNVFDTPRRRSQLVGFVVAATVVSAGLGIWQHFVGFPRLAADYVAERDELDRLTAIPDRERSSEETRRLAELRTSFESQGVPVAGPGRQAFENRLLGSREPLGRFALTNTFAGWLLVGTFALVGLLLRERGRGTIVTTTVAIGLAAVLYCLLLTKSRTAWVGLLLAATAWGVRQWLGTNRRFPRWGWAAIGGGGLLVVIGIGLAVGTGGLDREVLAQAPRSLRFRLQYWTGTAGVIADNPLLGTGPGNFRQHYVGHMPAEASEEIADPHNLVLDVWANAGPLALLALAATIWIGTTSFTSRDERPDPTDAPDGDSDNTDRTDVLAGVACGVLALVASAFLAVDDLFEPTMLGLAIIAATYAASRLFALDAPGLGWGAVAVLVHLLGAGGIGMPAVQLVVLVTVVVAGANGEGRPLTRSVSIGIGLTLGGLFAGQLVTATLPVVESSQRIASARAAVVDGQPARADDLFESAAERDRLAPEPAAEMARFTFDQWRYTGGRSDTPFRRAVRFQEEAIRRDPRSAMRRSTLADFLVTNFQSTGDRANGERAADVLAEAIELYPTNVEFHAQRAQLLADLERDDEARSAAAIAVRLDDVNRAEGHVDRVLPEADRRRIEEIASGVEPGDRSR